MNCKSNFIVSPSHAYSLQLAINIPLLKLYNIKLLEEPYSVHKPKDEQNESDSCCKNEVCREYVCVEQNDQAVPIARQGREPHICEAEASRYKVQGWI